MVDAMERMADTSLAERLHMVARADPQFGRLEAAYAAEFH